MAGYKGRFRPKNILKYKGDPTKIIYRSLLERRVMVWLDSNPKILEWQSELIIIKYISPLDSREHRYFPDFAVKYQKADGTSGSVIIEVKPLSQTHAPRQAANKSGSPKKSRRYLNECATWGVNDAKWKYARAWCAENGYEFEIWTEQAIDKITGVSTRKKRK